MILILFGLLLLLCSFFLYGKYLKKILVNFLYLIINYYIIITNLIKKNKINKIELKDTRIVKDKYNCQQIILYEYIIYLNNKIYKIISTDKHENLDENVKQKLKNLNLFLHIENDHNINIDDIKPYLFSIDLLWIFILTDLKINYTNNCIFTFHLNDNNLTEKTFNIQELEKIKIKEIVYV